MKKYLVNLIGIFFVLIFVGTVNAQVVENKNTTKSETSEYQEYDENTVITKKPRVGTARYCSPSSGITTVRVTFDKSAKVTGVEVVTPSGCKSFDRNAVNAAKKIKFKPAVKNGEPVTITKLVQYTYKIYIQ